MRRGRVSGDVAPHVPVVSHDFFGLLAKRAESGTLPRVKRVFFFAQEEKPNGVCNSGWVDTEYMMRACRSAERESQFPITRSKSALAEKGCRTPPDENIASSTIHSQVRGSIKTAYSGRGLLAAPQRTHYVTLRLGDDFSYSTP